MSQWTARSQQTARIHPHPSPGRTRAPRSSESGPRSAEPRERTHPANQAAAAYTLAHAGKQVRFGPVAFWIAVGTVVIMAVWSISSATYLAFRDDVLRTLIAHQAEQQFAYEDRIAELRAQIDRTTSHQLIDQEQFEQKLDELMRRQSLLESRATALGGGIDAATTGSLRPAAKPGAEPAAVSPRDDRGRQSSLGQSSLGQSSLGQSSLGQSSLGHSSIGAALGRVEAALDRVEHRQALALSQMQDRYENKARQIRSTLAQLGLRAETLASGGPFVPVRLAANDQAFGRALLRVNIARADANALGATLLKVPLRKPVIGDIDESSPFGIRTDPFVHEAAMHTGIDFRGDTGDPIRATAAGTVTIAGPSGGYGKMVEIDHGHGLATRYGHLSEIDVAIGDTVRAGAIVGKLGSTGRSTGPHLHYEVRVKGEAVDPQKYLDAGERLFGG
jgi:murein DD-endopeptidase MepM/ murein hydrolase activator NlpD